MEHAHVKWKEPTKTCDWRFIMSENIEPNEILETCRGAVYISQDIDTKPYILIHATNDDIKLTIEEKLPCMYDNARPVTLSDEVVWQNRNNVTTRSDVAGMLQLIWACDTVWH